MLYKKDKKKKRNYDYLATPPSNERLLKNIQKGQITLHRINKK